MPDDTPTPDEHAARIAELEERVRLLEDENEHLAESQADAFLLGLVAEQVQREPDQAAVLRTGLQRMSVLKDVPLCAVCQRVGPALVVKDAFLAFSGEPLGDFSLSPSPGVLARLQGGAILAGAACREAGLPATGPLARFVPRAVLLLALPSRALPGAVFVFADDGGEERLPRAAPVLQRAAESVLARLEGVALLEELQALNAELDEKVALRTQALRGSEERLRLALDAAQAAAFEWDLASGRVAWADAAAAVLGVAPGEVTGDIETYLSRVHDGDRASAEAALSRARSGAGGAPEIVVHRLRPISPGAPGAAGTPGLEDRWVELHARGVAGPSGAIRRVAGVLLDATARRRLEDELRQAQKMESVGRLAGGVAHDFNNLLTTVLGVSEMLLAGIGPDDPMREDLAAIRDAGRRAAMLTRQLLAFSRKQRLEIRPIQLEDVVRGFTPMLSRLIGEDVRVTLDLAMGLPAVMADPSQVEQILLNLGVNARDAMPGGGALEIQVAPGRAPAGLAVRLRVSDTGQGMTPEVSARIFEPFFTTKPRGRGTGLGLATVYGIITQHGGTVKVRTAPGRGTSFDILFPAAPMSAVPAPADDGAHAAPAEGRGETVLVVDDEPLVRRALKRALTTRGFAVLEAGSGEEALAVVRSRNGAVDLLLTDVVMPGMRGPDLARAFKETCPGRPTLLMSGYPDARDGESPLEGDYLQKPLTPDTVARAIRTALDQRA